MTIIAFYAIHTFFKNFSIQSSTIYFGFRLLLFLVASPLCHWNKMKSLEWNKLFLMGQIAFNFLAIISSVHGVTQNNNFFFLFFIFLFHEYVFLSLEWHVNHFNFVRGRKVPIIMGNSSKAILLNIHTHFGMSLFHNISDIGSVSPIPRDWLQKDLFFLFKINKLVFWNVIRVYVCARNAKWTLRWKMNWNRLFVNFKWENDWWFFETSQSFAEK